MTREELLALDDLPTETFDVPIWGSVTIKMLTGEQREELENLIQSFRAKGTGNKSVRALAAVFALVNTDGSTMFQRADAVALAKKSGVSLDAVWARVLKQNAMTKEEAGVIEGN